MDEAKRRLRLLGKIWTIAGKLGMKEDQLYQFLKDYDFHDRLSNMNIFQLNQVVSRLESRYAQDGSKLDGLGMYMYSLLSKAGWDYKGVNAYIQKRFGINKKYHLADSWRNLDTKGKKAVIGMLENYSERRKK